jgi:hypothetical protein
VTGISYLDYQSQSSLYDQTLIEALAACMTGVVPADIFPFTVTDPAAGRRLTVALRALQSTGDSLNLAYVVTTNTAGVTYTSMTTQLDAATSGSAFTTNLNAAAIANGATALQDCTSSVPVTVNTTPSESSGSDDDSLSGGAVAGIVIGVLVFVALLAAGSYYFFLGDHSKGSSNNNQQHSLSKDSTGSSGGSGSYQKKKAPMQENPVFGISAIASPKKGGKGHSNVDDSNM